MTATKENQAVASEGAVGMNDGIGLDKVENQETANSDVQKTILKRESLDFRTEEAYKTLRANLEFSGEDVRVIAFTSCIPNEGKSSVSVNLAISLAESGKKVILIDADLRKSVLVGRYKTGKIRYGLTHFLSGKKHFKDVFCRTDIKNLDMVFAGPVPPNPSELLGGRNFKVMVQKLREIYDYVIIDTPPLGSVIDSAVISKVCDGTVIVIASKAVSYRFAQKVKDQLEKADCRILGCVLNKVDLSSKSYYGNYYGKYYGKYYGNYENDK